MKAVKECGVEFSGAKIRDIDIGAYGDRTHRKSITARGIYCGSKGNFGFVTLENEERDVFIPGGNTRGAIDGDCVEVCYKKFFSSDGVEKTEGRIVKIIEYGRKTIIGTLCEDVRRHGRRYFRVFYLNAYKFNIESCSFNSPSL